MLSLPRPLSRRLRSPLGRIALFLLLTAVPSVAGAQTIYELDNQNNRLLEVDPNTGAASVVGQLGVTAGGAALMTKGDGTLWALLTQGVPGIYSIDTATGAATLDVQLDQSLGGVGAAFDPSGQDLYIVSGNSLYHADPTTGTTTLITSSLPSNFYGLTVSPGGTYYSFNGNIYTIDVTNGTTTVLGPPVGPASQPSNFCLDPSSDQFYSVRGDSLVRTDLATLQSTTVGALGLGGGRGGIAVLPAAIPTRPATWSWLKSRFGQDTRPPALR